MRHWTKLRKMRRLTLVPLVLALILSLAIAACGGDDEETPAPAAPTAAPTAAPAPAPTAAPTMAPTEAPAPAATPTRAPAATQPATPAATAAPTATAAPSTPPPTPRPTASPTPLVTPPPDRVPVDPQLKIAMVPPGNQVTMMWETLQSGTGPLKPMYEMLIGEDPFTGSWTEMGLASEWSVAPGAKDWTFKLREGIPYHSTDTWTGGEFTTKDIHGSIATLVREDAKSTASIWTNLGAQKPEAFDIVDDYNFTWRLSKGEPLFESYASSGWVATMLSKDYMDAVGIEGYRAHPIGTGPFSFIELKIDEHILYERVEDHWRKVPEFHELKFFYVKEDSTRLAMQLTDESHIADIPAILIPETLERGHVVSVGTLPGFFLYIWIGGLYYDSEQTIRVGDRAGETQPVAPGFDAEDPFRNVLVRKALNLAVNRDLLNQTFWDGDAIPQLIHGFPPTNPDFKHDDWTPYPYDPEAAKQALAEAGYPDGFEFDFQTSIVSGVPEAPDVAEAVTDMWRSIGLKPNLLPIEYGTMRSEMRARDVGRTVGTFRQGAGPGGIYTRGNIQYRLGPVPGGAGNGLWEIPALDDIWVDLAAAVEAEDILEQTYRIGDYLYENYITVPLFFLFPKAVVNPNFVVEYKQNMLHFGPAVNHEYTQPVYQ